MCDLQMSPQILRLVENPGLIHNFKKILGAEKEQKNAAGIHFLIRYFPLPPASLRLLCLLVHKIPYNTSKGDFSGHTVLL